MGWYWNELQRFRARIPTWITLLKQWGNEELSFFGVLRQLHWSDLWFILLACWVSFLAFGDVVFAALFGRGDEE